MTADPVIEVRGLCMAYGSTVIQRDLDFAVYAGDIFVIMGGSGCGKSTLLRHLIGLKAPASGDIFYHGACLNTASRDERRAMRRRWGITYQSGGLFSAMTLAENVALPLRQYTAYERDIIDDIVAYKLALVGLDGFQDYLPEAISGGMRKRAALARAIALDPELLFFDEPSAGLDPVSSRRLDDLILQIKETTGATVVMVTHELPSIFAIANNSVYLDAETRTMIDYGDPGWLRTHSEQPIVRQFLNREADAAVDAGGDIAGG
ncbi:MAG: ATP-binding cassette domain-containing protein [Chromatocurvus sp.]